MFGIKCIRSSKSQFGYGEAWLKEEGKLFKSNRQGAELMCDHLKRKAVNILVTYHVAWIAA